MDLSSTQSAVSSRAAGMNEEFIRVGEALKLIPPFKGDKRKF
jgi:hypothetical protein